MSHKSVHTALESGSCSSYLPVKKQHWAHNKQVLSNGSMIDISPDVLIIAIAAWVTD